MSVFKSSETVKPSDLRDKILFWGAQHTGKTWTLLTWPAPLLLDAETRGAHFADRFKFLLAECRTIEEIATACKEILHGSLPCETIGVDSATAIYYKFVELYTPLNGEGKPVTDWVAVNRRMLAFINFVFSIAGKNVIFTAHAGEKLIRQGRDFTKAGQQFIGDQKFRYVFDYVFRLESNGDPRVRPASFIVEKSASPNLKVGQKIDGLDYAKFIEITRGAAQKPSNGESSSQAYAPGNAPSHDGELPFPEALAQQIDAIKQVVAEKHFPGADIARIVRDVTTGRTTDYTKIKSLSEAAEVYRKLAAAPARQAS